MNKRKSQILGLLLLSMITVLSACGKDNPNPGTVNGVDSNYTAGSEQPDGSVSEEGPVKNQMEEDAEDMKDQADHAVEDARHGAMDAAEDAKDSMDNAGEKVKDAADDAGRKVKDAAEGAKRTAENAADDAKRMAEDALDPPASKQPKQ